MSLRILVFVGLRIYALYFILQIVSAMPMTWRFVSMGDPGPQFAIAIIAFMMLIALVLWSFAHRLAAAIVRGADTSIDKFGLTLEETYIFAFVFLGLYFILSTIGPALQQLYYVVAVVAQLSESDPQRSIAVFQLYKPGITVIAGFASLLGAPFWARKLVALGAKMNN